MRLDFPEAVDDASYRFARDVGLEPINDDNIELPSEDSMANVEQGSFRDGFISSFSMILLAEIADKTFFIACIMAMRYSRILVFAGAWGALVLMTGLSCALGHLVVSQTWISQQVIHYIAASLFAVFAVQMIYEGYKNRGNSASEEMEEVANELRADDEELRVRFRKNSKSEASPDSPQVVVEIVNSDLEKARSRAETGSNSPVISTTNLNSVNPETVSLRTGAVSPDSAENSVDESALKKALRKIEAFFLIFINPVFLKAFVLTFIAEWGDRSQLSTVVLAVSTNKLAVFIGGSLGHMICTGAAILFGRFISNKISLSKLNIAGGVIFMAFSGYTFYLAAMNEND